VEGDQASVRSEKVMRDIGGDEHWVLFGNERSRRKVLVNSGVIWENGPYESGSERYFLLEKGRGLQTRSVASWSSRRNGRAAACPA